MYENDPNALLLNKITALKTEYLPVVDASGAVVNSAQHYLVTRYDGSTSYCRPLGHPACALTVQINEFLAAGGSIT